MTSLRRLNIERLDNTIGLAAALDAALARLTNLTAVSLDSGVLASGVLVGGALLGSMEEYLPSLLALPRLAGLRLRYAGQQRRRRRVRRFADGAAAPQRLQLRRQQPALAGHHGAVRADGAAAAVRRRAPHGQPRAAA